MKKILPLAMLLVGLSALLPTTVLSQSKLALVTPTEEVLYKGTAERILFFAQSAQTKILIAGLTPGESYIVHLSPDQLNQANWLHFPASKDQETAQRKLEFTAQTSSQEVLVHSDYPGVLIPYYLSLRSSNQASTANPQNMVAVISTNSNVPVNTLVTEVFIGGDCYEVAGISFQGNNSASGTFTNGATSISINDGIMLSTGNIANAAGPNNQSGAGNGLNGSAAPDPDLASIVGGAFLLNDVAIIEFDVTPSSDTISFDYVFASEEYCDYTGSTFNDVFGFFISGPGIAGPYTGGAQNIAVLPGSGTPVAINNVNHINNPAYYVGNIPATSFQLFDPDCAGHPTTAGAPVNDCQFDGFTTVLTAMAIVQPCQTYHIKLAIADVGDDAFDSAVFLAANSFEGGGVAKVNAVGSVAGSNIIYEGCNGGYFEFVRDGLDTSEPVEITFFLSPSSTATSGIDYTPIPVTVTIPAGQLSVQIPIDAFPDGILEGPESIILELENPCECSNSTVELIIEDSPELDSSLEDQEVCGSQSVNLEAGASGGIPNYTYTWSTGGSGPSISVSPTMDTEYYVTITDDCGNSIVDTAMVTVLEEPTADISGSGVLCENGGSATVDLTINFTGTGPWEVVYAIDGVDQPVITTTDNPYTLSIDQIGVVTLSSVSNGSGGCPGTVSGSTSITETILSPNLTPTDVSCFGDTDGSISISVSGGTPGYTYTWDNGAGSGSNPTGLSPGTYSVTVVDANGCEEVASTTIADVPELTSSLDGVQNIDCNNPSGSIELTVNGGTPSYTYSWDNGGGNGQNPSGVGPGTYSVTITDANGCETFNTATVTEDLTPPVAAGAANGLITCDDPTIAIDGNGSSTGTEYTYQWTATGGSVVSGSTTLNPEVDGAGTYTLVVTNTNNGCTEEVDVVVNEDLTPPVVAGTGGTLTCTITEITLDGNGTSTGPDFSYEWTTTGGNIVSGSTGLNPVVDAPGSYTLTVEDDTNGCTSDLTISVGEDITPPIVNPNGGTITCSDPQVNLDIGSSSGGPGYTYQWTTPDGNIVSGGMGVSPTVDEPGTYVLNIVDSNNGCDASGSVQVGIDTISPIADAGPALQLDCNNPTITLNGNGSSSGVGIDYQWTTNNGNIQFGGNTISPTVNQAGDYVLVVTNILNGCEATAQVSVSEDFAAPVVDVANPELLTCYVPEIQLDGSGSSSGPGYSFDWSASPGNIVSGGNTPTPTIDEAGIYTLTVTNQNNGCDTELDVQVTANQIAPTALAGPPQELTCTILQVQLEGYNSSAGPNYTYEWITATGNIVSGGNSPAPIVNEPGTYQLTVTNLTNGCTSTSSTQVQVDEDVPIANAGGNLELNCIDAQVTLNGNNSSSGPSFSFTWSTTDGNIVSGDNTLNPVVNEPGTYELVVTNQDNGCDAFSTVQVTEDVELPVVTIAPPAMIDCYQPEIQLDGTGSSTIGSLSYTWIATSGGNIVGGQGTLMPTVDAGGTYILNIANADNGCSNSLAVNVNEMIDNPPIAVAPADTINCAVTSVTLDGSGSASGPEFVYTWSTTDGSILNGSNTLNPEVSSGGNYTLTVLNTSNNCSSEEVVEVPQDVEPPGLFAGDPSNLNCTISEVALNASITGASNVDYTWSTPNGNIVSGENSLSPLVNAPGTYQLNATNLDNNCSESAQVTIGIDVAIPLSDAGPPATLTCDLPVVDLDGSNSQSGPNLVYQWSTNNGNILNGANSTAAQVNQAGTYVLQVLNTDNTCTSFDTVQIGVNQVIPIAAAGTPLVLGCTSPTLHLEGDNSSTGTQIVYDWSTNDGNILSGQNTLSPLIDSAGSYILQVLDTINGCSALDTVQVILDLEEPTVGVGPGGELTCTVSSLTLSGNASGNLGNFIYEWQTTNGNVVSGGAGLNPIVDAAGIYQFIVTDTINGCSSVEEVVVTQDANVPTAIADVMGALNCVSTQVEIDGSSSTQSPTITFNWSTTNGNISAGGNTLTPIIDAPGTYTLTIEDSANDCVSTTSVTIPLDTLAPNLDIDPQNIINCYNGIIQLNAEVETGGDPYNWTWSTTNGTITGGQNTLQPSVSNAGTYELFVENTENGCVNTSSTVVVEDLAEPVLAIGNPQLLNCYNATIDLSATVNTQGDPYDLTWATQDGNIVAGSFGLSPTVNQAGTYSLSVQNITNGCETETLVTVDEDFVLPAVEAGADNTLTCSLTTLGLSGTGSSTGGIYTYLWNTTDGNILSGQTSLDPTIDAPGLYQLEVFNTENGCSDFDTVTVFENVTLPGLSILAPATLNCEVTELSLEASAIVTTMGNYSASWSTANGNVLSGGNSLNPLINEPGTYELTVIDLENGCENITAIPVLQDIEYPVVEAGEDDLLTCAITELQLDATNSQVDPTFAINWSSNPGNITAGNGGLTPTVDAPGWYILTIENEVNHCVSIDSVFVDQDVELPQVEAGSTATLTCEVPTLNLDASGTSIGGIYTYQWSTPDGLILAGQTGLNPEIGAPGTYQLEVLNSDNGCVDNDLVVVSIDTLYPVVAIATPGILTCSITDLAIDALGSSTGNEFNYQWTSAPGSILTGSNTLQPTIDAPGTYTLEILNEDNGCVSTASVAVDEDVAEPNVEIAPAAVLNCVVQSIQLSGMGTGTGATVEYSWSTSNGNITSGSTSPNPQIDAPGVYELLITDPLNGCTSSMQTTVVADVVDPTLVLAQPDNLDCVTPTVDISAAGSSVGAEFELLWSAIGGNIVNGQGTSQLTVDSPGTYTLLITNQDNGCTSEETVLVEGDYEEPEVEAGEDFILPCFEDSSPLSGQASGNASLAYTWTTSDGDLTGNLSSLTPEVTSGGTYYLVVLNLGNGCTAMDSVSVVEDIPITPEVDLVMPLCYQDPGALTVGTVIGGTPPYLYSVDAGQNFQQGNVFSGLPAGAYTVLVQDANGCETDVLTALIEQPDELVMALETSVTLQQGESYQLQAFVNIPEEEIASINWSPGTDLSCTTCLDPIVTPLSSTNYFVQVTNDQGCEVQGLVQFLVDKRPDIYVPNGFSPDTDGQNDVFMIFARDGSVNKVNKFLVFSRWGETVHEYYDFLPNDPAYGWDGTHRGRPLDPAVFVWFAEVEMIDGRIEILKGDVTLVR